MAAVTKAGGFGVLGAVDHTPERLDIDMSWLHKELGDRSFGVDIVVPANYEGKSTGGGGRGLGDLKAMIPPQHREFLDVMERFEQLNA